MRPIAASMLGIALLAAAPALAQETDRGQDAIAEARAMLRSFEYERAIERLDEFLRSGAASPSERITAYELRAVFLVLLGREEDARASAERMLSLDPGHRPSDPSYSPTIAGFFETVRREFLPSPSVELTVDAPSEVGSGERAEVEVTVAGGEGVERLMVYMRRSGEGDYRPMPLERRSPTRFTGTLPRFHTRAELTVDLFFEARAPSGYTLARAGSPEAPMSLRILPSDGAVPAGPDPLEGVEAGGAGPDPLEGVEAGEPWYLHWAFWTVVGVVIAAGVGIGIGVAVGTAPGVRVGDLGTAQLAP